MVLLFTEASTSYFCWNISLGNNSDMQSDEMSGRFIHLF